jgi:predicted PurR-regulated permease PerM
MAKTQPSRLEDRGWSLIHGALVVLTGAAFFLSIRTSLSPVLLYALFLLVLWPFTHDQRYRTILVAASLAFAVWVLDALGSLLAPFLLAIALAYILDPAVDALERRRLPRTVAIVLLALPVLGLLALLILIGIPALLRQISGLIDGLPAALDRFSQWLEAVQFRLRALDLPFVDEERLLAGLGRFDQERVVAFVQERQNEILERGWEALTGIGRGFGLVLSLLGYLVLTPVLLVFLLRDWDRITEGVSGLLPEASRPAWTAHAREYDSLLASFLRGQIVVAAIVGVLTGVGLWIAGFPYSGLVGAIAGVFNLVPYLGLAASVVPVIIIALTTGSFVGMIVKAAIVFAIVQIVDTVVSPRIVGTSVGLHPVWIMLAIAVAGVAFGFAGLLIAVPIAVLVKLVLREAILRYKASVVYRGETPTPPPLS